MKAQTTTKRSKKNSFKMLEKEYEKAFFKKEHTMKHKKLSLIEDLEMEFWVNVELKLPDVKVPDYGLVYV